MKSTILALCLTTSAFASGTCPKLGGSYHECAFSSFGHDLTSIRVLQLGKKLTVFLQGEQDSGILDFTADGRTRTISVPVNGEKFSRDVTAHCDGTNFHVRSVDKETGNVERAVIYREANQNLVIESYLNEGPAQVVSCRPRR